MQLRACCGLLPAENAHTGRSVVAFVSYTPARISFVLIGFFRGNVAGGDRTHIAFPQFWTCLKSKVIDAELQRLCALFRSILSQLLEAVQLRKAKLRLAKWQGFGPEKLANWCDSENLLFETVETVETVWIFVSDIPGRDPSMEANLLVCVCGTGCVYPFEQACSQNNLLWLLV